MSDMDESNANEPNVDAEGTTQEITSAPADAGDDINNSSATDAQQEVTADNADADASTAEASDGAATGAVAEETADTNNSSSAEAKDEAAEDNAGADANAEATETAAGADAEETANTNDVSAIDTKDESTEDNAGADNPSTGKNEELNDTYGNTDADAGVTSDVNDSTVMNENEDANADDADEAAGAEAGEAGAGAAEADAGAEAGEAGAGAEAGAAGAGAEAVADTGAEAGAGAEAVADTGADAGEADAGEGEAGADAGEADAGEGEAGADAGEADAGEGEAGADAGEADAGEGEAGADAGEADEAGAGAEAVADTGADAGEAGAGAEADAGEADAGEAGADADAGDVVEAKAEFAENADGVSASEKKMFCDEAATDRSSHENLPSSEEKAKDNASGEVNTTEADIMAFMTDAESDFKTQAAERKPSISSAPPPPPPLMKAMTEANVKDSEGIISAVLPVWSFGLNRHVPVINLSTQIRRWIFYASAHLGVLFDMDGNCQFILQGHSNSITCTSASADKRWLVTGDRGKDSMVVIWDSTTGMPVRTMFEPHPTGVVAISLTRDARYLATLSADPIQSFAIWDWTTGDEMPLCSATLSPSYGVQHTIHFSSEDVSHVVTNSDSQVLFYCWKGGSMEYYAPPLTDADFNKPVGKYSSSIFLNDGSRAVTATSQGLLVVWDCNTPLTKEEFGWKLVDQEPTPNKKAVKLVPMHDRGITAITIIKSLIATGDTAGHVKFFDQNLQLIYRYQDFNFGPVNSIDFANVDHDSNTVSTSVFPTDATIPSIPFIVRDFIIGTTTAVVANVVVPGTKVDVVIRDHDAPVHALSAHPKSNRIAVGGFSGLLKIWNYETKEAEVSRYFDRGNQIRCCEFGPDGYYLAVGFVSGVVRVLDAMTLSDVIPEPFHYSREEVTHLAFSHDGSLLVSADGEYTTTLFKVGKAKEDKWIYVGRHRAHYKPICDVLFGENLDNKLPRLLTLGEDRFLVEYDLLNARKDHLPILQKDRIEQSATPRCMMWYPPITKEQFLCLSNDQLKLKLINTTTKMCRKTLLGPTFGSPIKKMCVLPLDSDGDESQRYLTYIIDDKVGLSILPLDGNPHNSMCVISHPAGVTNLACSADGRYIFTAGGTDTTVQMWSINTDVLEAQSQLGGCGLVPFYALLEGGREGELFAELEDYFYYAQLRSQGINTMETRKVNTHIPISEVPFVMRAMGYYPTEQEIEDMMNEIKFSKYVETGEYVTEVDLDDFIRLFVNHRPVFGLDTKRIEWAFEKLGLVSEEGGKPAVDRTDLLDILQTHGEHMSEYELAEYVTTLLGFNLEGGSCELEEFDPTTAGDIIDVNLPVSMTAEIFTKDILSLGIPEAASKAASPAPGPKRSLEVQTE